MYPKTWEDGQMSSVLLEARNIQKTYRKGLLGKTHKILDSCSFTLQEGETLGLCGPSGCGKSTLGRLLAGLEHPDSGQIFFHGKNIFTADKITKKRIRQKIQILFQDPQGTFHPVKKLGTSLHRVVDLYDLHLSESDMTTILSTVGLHPEILNRYPQEISGGQAQRLALARILLLKPEFIILDEPTSGLDISVQAQILHLLKDLKKKEKISYLFISHDRNVLSFMSDRIVYMTDGKLHSDENLMQKI